MFEENECDWRLCIPHLLSNTAGKAYKKKSDSGRAKLEEEKRRKERQKYFEVALEGALLMKPPPSRRCDAVSSSPAYDTCTNFVKHPVSLEILVQRKRIPVSLPSSQNPISVIEAQKHCREVHDQVINRLIHQQRLQLYCHKETSATG